MKAFEQKAEEGKIHAEILKNNRVIDSRDFLISPALVEQYASRLHVHSPLDQTMAIIKLMLAHSINFEDFVRSLDIFKRSYFFAGALYMKENPKAAVFLKNYEDTFSEDMQKTVDKMEIEEMSKISKGGFS